MRFFQKVLPWTENTQKQTVFPLRNFSWAKQPRIKLIEYQCISSWSSQKSDWEKPACVMRKKATKLLKCDVSNFNHPSLWTSFRDESDMPEWNWVKVFRQAGMCPPKQLWVTSTLSQLVLKKSETISLRMAKISWIFTSPFSIGSLFTFHHQPQLCHSTEQLKKGNLILN